MLLKLTCSHVSCKACIHVYLIYNEKILRVKKMAEMLRLSSREKELLRNKAVELNKKLISKRCEPIKDTELAHIVIEQAVELAEVSESGKVIILK